MKARKLSFSEYIKQPAVQRIGSSMLALLVISSVAYFGTLVKQDSSAALPGTLYLSPATGSFAPGSNVTVDIREESGTAAVNTVQAALVYNTAQLQFVSVSDSPAFPQVLRTDATGTPGQVRIARAVDAGSAGVTGDQQVVRVTFRVLATSGTTSLSFDNAISFIVRASDSSNIMTTSTGAAYSVAHLAPTLTTVAPTTGSTVGGTIMTLTGTNFRAGATVTVGGTAATNVVVVSPTQITATSPAHASGSVSVVVTNSDGQSATRTSAFQYSLPAPTVSSVTPVQGATVGGNQVTVLGNNFVSGATVRFGTTNATTVTFVSVTQLTVTVPARTAGTVDVSVTNPDGQVATKTAAYTFVFTGPVVSSLSLTSGFTSGGATITITGQNFVPGATVTFGGTSATAVAVLNGNTISVVTPSKVVGAVNVMVTNPDGQAGTLASAYTYKKAGDSNGDAKINVLDYSALASHDGQNYPPADYDGDGVVGATDLAILLANWTW